jgi:hypothetical protein
MTSAWGLARNTPAATGPKVKKHQSRSLSPPPPHCLGQRGEAVACCALVLMCARPGVTTLEEAEEEAFRQTCDHAGVKDGMTILDLGCGWGSLTLCGSCGPAVQLGCLVPCPSRPLQRV